MLNTNSFLIQREKVQDTNYISHYGATILLSRTRRSIALPSRTKERSHKGVHTSELLLNLLLPPSQILLSSQDLLVLPVEPLLLINKGLVRDLMTRLWGILRGSCLS